MTSVPYTRFLSLLVRSPLEFRALGIPSTECEQDAWNRGTSALSSPSVPIPAHCPLDFPHRTHIQGWNDQGFPRQQQRST